MITDKDMKALVKHYVDYKKAEAAYKEVKDRVTKDLPAGQYTSDYGCVTKREALRETVDTTRLFDEHPDINKDDYTKQTEVTTVTIKNLMKSW